MRTVFLVLIAGLLIPTTALAQDEDYDPEYDDEEAAGDLSYDDEEAAGEPDEWALDEDESAGFEAEGEASTEGEGVLSWEAESETDAGERAERKPWEWGAIRHHSTLTGSTGLLHMQEAGSGPAGTFGIGVHGTWFKYTDYIIYKDENTGMWGDVNIRITPLDFLEVHYGIQTAANYNNKEYPTLFQTLGDMDLGVKLYVPPTDWWTLGLDLQMFMLNSVGEVSMDWSGTSFAFDLISSMDFAAIDDNAPLRLHILIGYMFDNAANLIEDIEKENGGCGTDNDNDGNVDYAGCLSPVERTALGIDRNDQFRLGVGVDSLLPYISPMVEYMLEVPVNRQDFTCPKNAPGSPDSCMVEEGGSAFRQILTLGVRLLPHIDDLAIDIGVDIGLTGYAPTVHEMAAAPPWRLIFGASYNYDPFFEPPPPPPPPPCPEPPPPPLPAAYMLGLVHDEVSVDTPVAEASVSYTGLDLNSQVTGNDGRFKSYDLPVGTLTLVVTADGYHEGTFTVEVPDTGEIEESFALKAKPKLGTIAVTVTDDKDAPISGENIKVEGPTDSTEETDSAGRFEIEREEGEYTIVADVEGYLSKRVKVDVKAETRSQIQLILRKKPKKALVVVKEKRIVIKRKIHFETNSDEIKSKSFGILDEVVDTLLNHPEIKKVEIQGHTDSRGKRDYNIDLSERRARSVKRYLHESGVQRGRLESKGFGPDKPIAPNITGAGRARNRRVEFHIVDRAE
jgi:outer membrane protein OmpA-like peptidoglycan-associated protein